MQKGGPGAGITNLERFVEPTTMHVPLSVPWPFLAIPEYTVDRGCGSIVSSMYSYHHNV